MSIAYDVRTDLRYLQGKEEGKSEGKTRRENLKRKKEYDNGFF